MVWELLFFNWSVLTWVYWLEGHQNCLEQSHSGFDDFFPFSFSHDVQEAHYEALCKVSYQYHLSILYTSTTYSHLLLQPVSNEIDVDYDVASSACS